MAKLIVPEGVRRAGLTARCPGATLFDGPVGDVVVVCGPLKRDRDLDDVAAKGSPMSVAFSSREDALQVTGFCCDRYEDCGIWSAEVARVAARAARFQDVPSISGRADGEGEGSRLSADDRDDLLRALGPLGEDE